MPSKASTRTLRSQAGRRSAIGPVAGPAIVLCARTDIHRRVRNAPLARQGQDSSKGAKSITKGQCAANAPEPPAAPGRREREALESEDVLPGKSALASILIVNYRAYTELASCLDSLRIFLADDLEVILVDHASDPAATPAFVQRFPWVHLIRRRRQPWIRGRRQSRRSRRRRQIPAPPEPGLHRR